MMKTNTNVKLAAVLVALAGASAASAQSTEKLDRTIEGRLDQPLEGRGTVGASTMMMTSTDGDNTYSVEVRDGKTTATVNGKQVPSGRVRRTGDAIELLDADGGVLAKFDVPAVQGEWRASRTPRALRFREGKNFTPLAEMHMQPPAAEKMKMEPPKVMVGIRMTDDSGEVVVDEAVEGLPAEKAGVMVGDVLLWIGDTQIKQVGDVRVAIKEHGAGDKLDIKVRRDGKERTLSVKLEAYDAQKLPMFDEPPQIKVEGFPGSGDPAHGRWRDDVRKHIEEALSQLKNNDALSSDKLRMHLEQAMNQALASLDKAKDETSLWLRHFNAPEGGQGNARAFVWGGDNPDHVFAVPGGGDDNTAKRLEKVSDQLDKLSRRLDDIQKRLDAMDKPR